jgi:heme/copper-type cytochrome/quinol oxidase subunit 2
MQSMRFIALDILATIAALVFVTMLVATALQRPRLGAEGPGHSSILAEYLWAVVPWLIMAACVFPSVRRIVAGS